MLGSRIVKGLLCALALAALSACGMPQDKLQEMVAASMKQNFESEFRELQFEDRAPAFDAPARVYRGDRATVLAVGPARPFKEFAGISWQTVGLEMTGIARTENGRYFHFSYASQLRDDSLFAAGPCIERKCRSVSGYEMSLERAKGWLFNNRDVFTPELYEKLFGEVPPARREPA
ncbi:hypothetical protein D3C71_25170 [compost metagenome]